MNFGGAYLFVSQGVCVCVCVHIHTHTHTGCGTEDISVHNNQTLEQCASQCDANPSCEVFSGSYGADGTCKLSSNISSLDTSCVEHGFFSRSRDALDKAYQIFKGGTYTRIPQVCTRIIHSV